MDRWCAGRHYRLIAKRAVVIQVDCFVAALLAMTESG